MPQQNKGMKNQYDVVVIGAGIGGLTCGAFLAKEGMSVLIAEQQSKPGGYCTSFLRNGFTFNVGFDFFVGAERGGMFDKLLDELGLKDEMQFVDLAPPSRIAGSDYNLPLTPLEDLAAELKKMFPGDVQNIDTFFQDCKAVTSEILALAEPSPDLLGIGGKIGVMIKFLFKSPNVKKYGGQSYREALKKYFKEPKLRAILASLDHYDPGWAATEPMKVVGFPAFQYPRGGSQALADVFSNGVKKHGGELALKSTITKIMVENGKAVGVQLGDGSRVNARYVVSNVDARQTFLQLIGEKYLTSKFVKELNNERLSAPVLLVSLGVDMDLKAMGFDGTSIVYNRSDNVDDVWGGDPEKCSLWIMMHSLRDPSHAPAGKATVQLMTQFPYNYMDYWKREMNGTRGKEYSEIKDALASKLIVAAEEVVPQLSKHIVCKDIATPLTFERYTSNSEGACYGWFPGPKGKLRSQKTPIKNLYQAGHWTFPGGSIFAVALSGRNAARLVLKDTR
ncbi:amine oxidase [Desulfosarcina widdelii]|uniref:Amine oxidase n=1 Tax=Desulfosarcina widdelii TaxID=947919 RepID=A0A5K7Z1W5_9BACT|nr:NAD(P)/FAD-dependent oxidoreductase [Desulfosarcina widdelii]BBO74239.1 amine oxidase [Desulfosarcina widdelii]